jgi:hypothetical protein
MVSSLVTLAQLTSAQLRILDAAYKNDAATFNGKQKEPVETLHELGLIERTIEFKGGRHEITVRLKPAGVKLYWQRDGL